MYRNILVPLAYAPGKPAQKELAAAKALAAPGARFTLLHVMGPVPEFSTEHLSADSRSELRKVIEHDLERLADTLLGAEAAVIEGESGDAIVEWARTNGADCIVLAPHRTNTGQYGSTASRVARHAPCTVHLVR